VRLRRDKAANTRRVVIVRWQDVYELGLQREAEALAAAGYDTEVICMRDPERPKNTVVNDVRITSLPVRLRKTSTARQLYEYLAFALMSGTILVKRHLRRRYAVVQVNTMPDWLVFVAAIPKALGARVIIHMKEPSPELADIIFGRRSIVRLFERIEQRALRFSDHALTVTEALKRRYVEHGAPADRITVVFTGAAPESQLADWTPPQNAETDGFTLICHGTFEDRYGHDTIIDAAALLRDELPDLRVVFTGRGSTMKRMDEKVAELGLGDIVRNEGWVTFARVNDLLATADVGVVAQKASAYSHLVHTNKMIDYWMFGLPVIHSRLRATEEVYDDSVLEYFEPGNAEALAAAIRRLHDDENRREELARNGRLALERHGWPVQRQIYLGVYERLLGESPNQALDFGYGR
jgi:glycosyltransferase involved in cell wall biosynthesis